ncbi:MAG: RNA-binding protein [Candidatus Aenigmarchaeota archaeon ex4484_224]|nr:MAG: RNA-binding protein [Candidatus Aenigmarchaeota archaeon ex4484_224]
MVEIRPLVLPGELIDERKGRKLGNTVYEENGKVYSKVLGIPKVSDEEISVVPLAGVYMPKVNDRIIGIIDEVEVSGWFVDINSPYKAFLPLQEALTEFVDISKVDITRFFDIGDIIFARISKVTKHKIVQVSMKQIGSRKLIGGTVIKITPTKVARVIGKGGSMINLIKEKTKSQILVGQNGLIWIRGGNVRKAIEAILMIERESHIIGLTEKIAKFLEEGK